MANKEERHVEKTIMFTDVVESTNITDFLCNKLGNHEGNVEYQKKVRTPHNELIRSCLEKDNGYEVKTNGDSFMAVFTISSDAIRAAAYVINNLKIPNPMIEGDNIQVRIGIEKALILEVIDDGKVKDYEYQGVSKASRIEALASGSQVLLSDVVRESVGKLPGFIFHRWGKRELKGITDPC